MNDVHVWLIIKAETNIQRLKPKSTILLRRDGPPLRRILLPKFGDGFSLFDTNDEIIIAPYEETLPLIHHQFPDSAKTVRMFYLKLSNQPKNL